MPFQHDNVTTADGGRGQLHHVDVETNFGVTFIQHK